MFFPSLSRLHPLCLAALTLAFALPALAQEGSIELVITDAGGDELANVEVRATDASGAVKAEETTNKKGKVKLKLSDPGLYQVAMSHPEFASRTDEIEVKAGMVTSATMVLLDPETHKKQLAVNAFNRGVELIQGGDAKQALPHFDEAAELDPTLAEAHRLLAIIRAGEGDIEGAQPALQAYLQLQPDGLAKVSTAAYDVYRKTGQEDRLPEVREHLRTLGAHQDFAIRVFNEGVEAVQAKENETAMALFEEAARLDPELVTTHRSMAALQFNDGKFAEALPHLGRALELDPNHREARRLVFYSHFELGRTAEAESAASAWKEVDPTAIGQILEQADKLFETNQSQQAEAMVRAALAAAPEDGKAHYDLGRILAQRGAIAEAKEHLQRFLDLAPDHAEAETARQMLAGL